jgi:hypothetical protein
MFQRQDFTHHGRSFTIEADDWPTDEAACAAIIDLQIWTLRLGPEETAGLHTGLRQETEALLHDAVYDRDAAPLPAVRHAQRLAIHAGLQGQKTNGLQPTVTIDAADLWAVQLALEL